MNPRTSWPPVLVAALLLLSACTATAEPRPNVVLVVLDDVRVSDVAFLPSVQELASRGTTLSRTFAAFSLCTPSRASLLTGNTPAVHGIRNNQGQNFDPSSTIAVWLQDAGYRTGLLGKYLNEPPRGGWPKPPGWETWKPFKHHNDHGREQSLVLLDQAREFISEPDPRPFFLYLAPAAAHAPLWGPPGVCDGPFPPLPQPPNFDPTLLGGKLEKKRWPQRLSALCGADILIRGVLESLPENTVVVVTSDNGFSLGEHGWVGKSALWEEVIRVPLVISGPRIPVGTSPRIVSTVDIARTLAEFAGASHPEVEGRSIFSGEQRRWAPIECRNCTGKRRTHSKVTWCGGVTRIFNLQLDPLEMNPLYFAGAGRAQSGRRDVP